MERVDKIATGVEKQIEDAKDLREQNRKFLEKCKKDKVVKLKFPKAFSTYFGSGGYITWTYNGIPVTAYFDDREHEYPEFVANWLREKVNRCLASFFPVNEETKLH